MWGFHQFFHMGREALLIAVRRLGLIPGDTVIVPAHMCSSTIEPILNHGYHVEFMDIDQHMHLPVDSINEVSRRKTVKALLLVHYYGFPANIDAVVDVCRENQIKVIEDCAHCFLSRWQGRRIGSFGDAAIYSMRKTLPVMDGGALRINRSEGCKDQTITTTLSGSDYMFAITSLIESFAINVMHVNLYGDFIKNIRRHSPKMSGSEKEAPDIEPQTVRPSSILCAYLHDKSYLNRVMARRRQNYMSLAREASRLGYRCLKAELDDGDMPQAFPIYDMSGELVAWLRRKGVGAYRWPDYEMPEEVRESEHFHMARYFNRHLAMLPVHQSIGRKHINRMVALLHDWKKEKSSYDLG